MRLALKQAAASARVVARPAAMRTQNLRASVSAAPVASSLNHTTHCRWISSSTRSVRLAPAAATQTSDSAATSDPAVAAAAASASDDASADSHPPLPAPLFLRMPPIDGVGKCRLLRWVVEEGARFDSGDVLAEIDSDLAVIEYKAQSGGVMALRRVKAGDKIIDGQILAVQVDSAEQIPSAQPWLKHVETLAKRERHEREEMEAKEEAEEEVIRTIEKEQQEAEVANAATKQ